MSVIKLLTGGGGRKIRRLHLRLHREVRDQPGLRENLPLKGKQINKEPCYLLVDERSVLQGYERQLRGLRWEGGGLMFDLF